ncbi:maleate cis-trans isomerase family protein [Marinivivus vitaminiproducens]|uniref:maleate cis-trans isomerase family protein n=1 Tax=Marinivivus vitaminiproducens TaxID=3035935 RepID=UPI00279F213F|nr:aspartate/glutamate racemase family protein [Geminicoccaceae bacterium SCSIO 64248]
MRTRRLLGMLTPSSNTVLEPTASAMAAGLDEVSVHFGRFRVTEISLGAKGLGQFADGPMLDAAALLADAEVDVICWNGTSSGWLGFGHDRRLCAAIADRTGIAACTSVLAMNEAMRLLGARSFGLVTPYTGDVQARILATYAAEGFACAAERHLDLAHNFSFAEVDEATVAGMVREVAAAGPDVVLVFCTNLRGARLAPALEAETGLPVLDTVATGLWHALGIAGVDPARVRGWGRLFDLAPPPA